MTTQPLKTDGFECKVVYLDFERLKVSAQFIEDNNLNLNRTHEEIFTKFCEKDIMGFKREVLINYLEYNDQTSQVFTDEYNNKIKSGEISPHVPINNIFEAVQDFLDYMVFAWGKALDKRGISANRSIDKLSTYLWLFGREDLTELIQRDNLYPPYGMPALISVCEKLEIEVPKTCREFLLGAFE